MSPGAQTVASMVSVLVCVGIVWWLMWRGWVDRGRQQSADLNLPEPRPLDPGVDPDLVPGGIEGIYASTTLAHRHTQRIVVHGLGTRSAVRVVIDHGEVLLLRRGARSLRIPAADLVGVRRTRGQAGKYTFGKEGMVVITWRLAGVELDTGVRTRRRSEAALLVGSVRELLGAASAPTPAEGAL